MDGRLVLAERWVAKLTRWGMKGQMIGGFRARIVVTLVLVRKRVLTLRVLNLKQLIGTCITSR